MKEKVKPECKLLTPISAPEKEKKKNLPVWIHIFKYTPFIGTRIILVFVIDEKRY